MSQKITKEQLQKIMETTSPEAIRRDFGRRLDEEAKVYFQAFESMTASLDSMHSDMVNMHPPAPRMPAAVLDQTPKTPWWRQRWAIPAWAFVPVVVLALANPILSSVKVFRTPATGWEYRSTAPPDRDRAPLDDALFEAALQRGIYFYEKGDKESQRLALKDFQLAQSINPDHPRLLEYLALIHESLGNKAESESYMDRFRKIEDDLP